MFWLNTLLSSLIGIPITIVEGAESLGKSSIRTFGNLVDRGRKVEAARLKQLKQLAESAISYPREQRQKVVQMLDRILTPENLMPLERVHELRRDVEELKKTLEKLRESLGDDHDDKAA